MADFFTSTSVVDKAATSATTLHEDQNVQAAPKVVESMNEVKESGKGSNFSMCEIIM